MTNTNYLVSREQDIHVLRRTLLEEGLVFLMGERGIGKTTLLYQYKEQFASEYHNKIFISSNSLTSEDVFKGTIFNQLYTTKWDRNDFFGDFSGLIGLFKGFAHHVKSLIIIDDFDITSNSIEFQNKIISEILEHRKIYPHTHTIISSTGHNNVFHKFHSYQLSNFSIEQSLQLLHNLLNEIKLTNNYEIGSLSQLRDELLYRLDGNPLLINRAAKHLINSKSIEEFRQMLELDLNTRANSLIMSIKS
jgi:hypothetical protein